MLKLAVFTLVVIGGIFWFLLRPGKPTPIDMTTFVETPEYTQRQVDLARAQRTAAVAPRFNPNAAEVSFQWPAFKAGRKDAPPLQLKIRSDQWAEKNPVAGWDDIGPWIVNLKLEWPPFTEAPVIYMDQHSISPEGGGPMNDDGRTRDPVLELWRAKAGRDLLFDAQFRKSAAYATHESVAASDTVVIHCGRSPTCTMHFEYRGRSAELHFPRRYFRDWDAGYQAAIKLLDAIASPIPPKGRP